MSDQDRPLFLVVTIKPRADRLAEAEAQLQSMRRNTLAEPGCVFMHLAQPHDDPDAEAAALSSAPHPHPARGLVAISSCFLGPSGGGRRSSLTRPPLKG
jgi:hypothetical protein